MPYQPSSIYTTSSIVDVPTLKTIKNDRDSKFLEHPFDAASYPIDFFWSIK